MIKLLSLDEILELCKSSPEQAVFDWKIDFVLPKDQEKQGELIKDITAIANAISSSPGYTVGIRFIQNFPTLRLLVRPLKLQLGKSYVSNIWQFYSGR